MPNFTAPNAIRLLSVTTLSAGLLFACGPKPEDACANYMKVRKADDWPASPEIEKACVKDLEKLKGKMDKSGFKHTAECVAKAKSMEDANECPTQFMGGQEEMLEEWATGLAVEASGSWADEKGALEESHCNEAAFVIKRRKAVFDGAAKKGSFSRAGEAEFRESCIKNRKDNAAATNVRCLRKAESEKAALKCMEGGVSDAARDTAVGIEACVSKCRGEHPGGASAPGYMPCFTECKRSKGIP